MIIKHLLVSLIFASLTLAACGNKDGKKDDKKDDKKDRGHMGVFKPSPNRPITYPSAAAFHKDYRSVMGVDSIKKFGGKRIMFTGTVKRVLNLPNGSEFRIAAEGKHYVAVQFRDKGARARKHGLKAGSKLSVDCKILGVRTGNNISCGDCELDERLLVLPPKRP